MTLKPANYESVHMTGPLPAGTYTISPMIKNHPQGKYKNYMKLTLDEDNQMYGINPEQALVQRLSARSGGGVRPG